MRCHRLGDPKPPTPPLFAWALNLCAFSPFPFRKRQTAFVEDVHEVDTTLQDCRGDSLDNLQNWSRAAETVAKLQRVADGSGHCSKSRQPSGHV
eukprot:bmy_05154T0